MQLFKNYSNIHEKQRQNDDDIYFVSVWDEEEEENGKQHEKSKHNVWMVEGDHFKPIYRE